MRDEHKKIPTSAEVFAVIMAAHRKDLGVFSSYSNPTGSDGLTNTPQMFTEWGFRGSDFPLIGHESRWEKGGKDHERVNEENTYWICVGITHEEE